MKVLIGNLFESQAQTLVNAVNCVGVMGKGIALEFKKRFPDMSLDYEKRCRRGEVALGHPYIYKQSISSIEELLLEKEEILRSGKGRQVPCRKLSYSSLDPALKDRDCVELPVQDQYSFIHEEKNTISSDKWVVNFPTKDHWRSLARLDSIIDGVQFLLDHYKSWGIQSLAIPALGCGEGQLEWRVIGPTLYRYLSKMDIPIEFYAPYNTHTPPIPQKEIPDAILNWIQVEATDSFMNKNY